LGRPPSLFLRFSFSLLLGSLALHVSSAGQGASSIKSPPVPPSLDARQNQPRAIKDDLGHPWRLGPPPARIVSLAPNVTEILFALGLGGRVVGVTRYCDYPPEAARIEKVGGLVDPSIERVGALKPDLVLAFRGNPVRLLEKMRNVGLPVFSLEPGLTLESLLGTVGTIGLVTGGEEAARALTAELAARIAAIEASVAGAADKPKVFLKLQGQGLWTCGRESYLDALIQRAGAVNIAGEIGKKWALLGREELLRQDPNVILILAKTREGFDETVDWFRSEPYLGRLRAVVEGRIALLDENKASRFGPRLVDAFEEMVAAVHPGLAGQESKR
jgi:iron complex transport system substrate-binding protein